MELVPGEWLRACSKCSLQRNRTSSSFSRGEPSALFILTGLKYNLRLTYKYFRFEKNKHPPYWNSTSGFDFGFDFNYIIIISMLFCIMLPILSKSDHLLRIISLYLKAKGPKRPLTMQYTYKIIQTIHKNTTSSKAVITNGATLNNQTGKCFVD